MVLSPAEIASVVIGLGGGFWLVSRIMENDVADQMQPGDSGAGRKSESTDKPSPEDSVRPESSQSCPWWEVLGVSQFAKQDEISRAYKRKISEYHPDKVAQMGEEIRAVAERKSKEINAAYEVAMRR